MSTPSSDSQSSASVRIARQIDERCDQFEEQWKRGPAPRLEDFLTNLSDSTRLRLLEELLLLDVFFRTRAGEVPATQDYLARFPELTSTALDDLIRRSGGASPKRGSTPGDQSTVAHQSGDSSRVPGPRLRYFGDYELLEQIARGGMGVVYKARQISLNRLVAVKMILSGQFASEAQVKRFYSEAESAAQLDHPNIVSIFEVGEHEGDHYFAMALVEGTSLAAKLSAGPVEPRAAAELVSQVAQAIEYAHSKGVIHRDLKPSNILLDAQGRPRVTDFGLAKRVSDADGLTMTGDVLGTPSYMPPEQAAGKIDAVGPASDVYALGAVLYALLAGRPPFQAASSVDTLRQVVDQEPVRLRQLNAAIPRDLETIAQKCLEKSVAKRYTSAAALAHDLDNYLAGRPIQARPTSRIERAWRLCRRNPVVASSIVTTAITAVGFLIAAGFSWRNAEARAQAVVNLTSVRTQLTEVDQQRITAQSLADQARQEVASLTTTAASEQAKADAAKAQAESASQDLKVAKKEAFNTRYAVDVQLAQAAMQNENMTEVYDFLARYETPTEGDDPRGFEWYYLHRQMRRARLSTTNLSEGTLTHIAVSADGKMFATAAGNTLPGTDLRVWSVADGKLLRILDTSRRDGQLFPDSPMLQMLYFADEGRTLTAIAIKDEAWRSGVSAKQGTSTLQQMFGRMQCYSFSLTDDRPYRIEPVVRDRVPAGLSISNIGRSNDGRFLALSGSLEPGFGQLTIRDATTDEIHAKCDLQDHVSRVVFSPTDDTVAVARRDGIIELRQRDLSSPRALFGHQNNAYALQFTSDGRRLISASSFINIWDVATAKKLTCLRGHVTNISALALSNDDNTLVSGDVHGVLKVWNLTENPNPCELRSPDGTIVFSGIGNDLVSVTQDGTFHTWDLEKCKLSRVLKTKAIDYTHIGARQLFDGGNSLAYANSKRRTLHLLSSVTGMESIIRCDEPGGGNNFVPMTIALSPDARLIAASDEGRVAIWKIENGKQIAIWTNPLSRIDLAVRCFTPDGKMLVLTYKDTVVIWNWEDDTAQTLCRCESYISGIGLSADGTRIGTASADGICIWDVQTGKLQATCVGAGKLGGGEIVFSPDGRRIAIECYGQQQQLKLWNADGGREVFSAPLSPSYIDSVWFSPDGTRLVANTLVAGDQLGKYNNVIHVWDASPVTEREFAGSDANELQGSWVVVSDETSINGTRGPTEPVATMASESIVGSRFTFAASEVTIETNGVKGEPTAFRLGTAQQPLQIDILGKSPSKGIFEVTSKELILCYSNVGQIVSFQKLPIGSRKLKMKRQE